MVTDRSDINADFFEEWGMLLTEEQIRIVGAQAWMRVELTRGEYGSAMGLLMICKKNAVLSFCWSRRKLGHSASVRFGVWSFLMPCILARGGFLSIGALTLRRAVAPP